jgi:3-oxoadipate enol-lactonase
VGQFVTTKRGDFYVEQAGADGTPVIVLVAGLGDDHTSWAQIVATLGRTHRCVAFDNRGIGRSPITAGPYVVAELAEDAHELIKTLGVAPVVAVGSSMGGAICQEWALAYPEDMSRLVLTNTWAERDPFLTVLFDHWIRLAQMRAGAELLRSLLLFCHSPDFMRRRPEVIDEFLAGPAPDLSGFAAAAAACREHHVLDRVDRIDHPVLVVAGARDILTPPALSERLAERLPNASLRIIDAAHMVFWEQPAAFTSITEEFLSGAA